MGRQKRSLINASPLLLAASKEALRLLITHPTASTKHDEVVELLRKAIDKADPVDTAIKFVVTPMTADELKRVIKERDGSERLQDAIERSARYTKQRVYIALEYNPVLLNELYEILKQPPGSPSFRAFLRMSEQLEEEIKKGPLQRLAELSF